MDRWSLGLAAWIIQDGNYADFRSDQVAEFAVEFSAREPLVVVDDQPLWIRPVGECSYEICARVSAVVDHAWALDCGGLGVFQDGVPPAGRVVDEVVQGMVHLGVDPFFYFERLHAVAGMPPLIYTWQIKAIARDAAPLLEMNSPLVRDPDRLGWTPLERTDAWHDDDGHASYMLDCLLLDVPPKRTSVTAC